MWMTLIVDQWMPFHGSLHLIPLLTDWHLAGFCTVPSFHSPIPPLVLVQVHGYSHARAPTVSASCGSPLPLRPLSIWHNFFLNRSFFYFPCFLLHPCATGSVSSLQLKATTCSKGSGHESSEPGVIKQRGRSTLCSDLSNRAKAQPSHHPTNKPLDLSNTFLPTSLA